MNNSGGMLDAYLICQALGWEWNLNSMIILTVVPLIIFFIIIIFWLLITD